MKTKDLLRVLPIQLIVAAIVSGCAIFSGSIKDPETKIILPFIKNSPNECYFLDDFMPVPDALVTGKSGSMNLRYYTYNYATYKDWGDKHIILSFYSKDNKCWSLFEEYYVSN